MSARVAADLVVVVHLAFILFVVLGGVLVAWWSRLAWLHIPAVLWGAAIEFTGLICPLTPLENRLRIQAGEQGYDGGFIEQYLIPLVYPAGLTRDVQMLLGSGVLAVNVALYGVLVFRWWRRRHRAA